MKRKSKLVFSLVAILFSSNTFGQYYFYNDKYYEDDLLFEVGVSGGIMNCFTDVGGKKGVGKKFIKDLNMKNTQACGGVYAVATYKNVLGLRLEATFGNVKAYDSILKGVDLPAKNRFLRNLNFRSPVTEFSMMLEVHPLFLRSYEDQDPPRISPYLVGGVSMYNFKPQGNLNGVWVDLNPLRTEGQGFAEYPESKRYKLNQMNVPIGLGVKYELGSLINARIEIIHRILFTDYLDDVSKSFVDPSLFANYLNSTQAGLAQAMSNRSISPDPNFSAPLAKRGNPNDNDAYFSVNFKLGITLGRSKIK
jgi:hypothetical protein